MRRIVDFVSGFATNVTLEAVKVVTEAIRDRLPSALATDRLKVDGSGVTQPVSGTVAISGTPTISGAVTVTSGAIDVSSLPATPTGSNTIGAVTGPSAVALARDSTLTDATQRAGVLGADGATLASASNPVPVTPGTSTLWDVKDRVGRLLGILTGKDGASVASVTNGLPVAPETSSTWDVSSRAARLIGALTGVNGSAVATLANPVPAQLSDGSTGYTGAKTGQLPTSLGQAARASSLGVTLSTEDAAKVPSLGQALAASSVPVVLTAIQIAQLAQTGQLPATLGTLASSASVSVVRSVASIDKQTTLATAGKVIKASAGICYGLTSYFNNTGGAIFFQVFNTIAAPTAGDRPDYFSASIANGTKSSLGFGITALGIGCPTGITFAVSSTQDTFTAIASTAVIYALQYD